MTTILTIISLILLFALLVFGIEFLIVSFQESILWGLACLFFGPAQFLFLIIHWDVAKRPFIRSLITTLILIPVFLLAIPTESFSNNSSSRSKVSYKTSSSSNSRSSTSVSQVLGNRSKYNNSSVSLRGTIRKYQQRTSKKGNRYTVFTLQDNTGGVVVHYRGHLGCQTGQYVEVNGVFQTIKRVGNRSYYNQIEARRVSPVAYTQPQKKLTAEEERQRREAITDRLESLNKPKPKLIKIGGNSKKSNNSLLTAVHKNKLSKIQVSGLGEVIKILPDDVVGDKHQRFVLQVTSELSILIAHNIDLAPRISSLKVGEEVKFSGQYEWNDEGGVVHWTHHDPKGKHRNGWLQHNKKKYQ